ncbi:Nucleotide-binding universal stress protein, UspA family [Enhydrobacter aerosaccus]|uniref:Nucleotide-binding universal stress protein, UspA family n=1 Tax=Enhydrobacter aerosaccus TaxID=225324 RepID=A0A1T4PF38_9HYPH|nr:universal stress protein [Enhydrobacter aerosaccus]SJZ89971.1 Nucleotide-binding universal stress protein, UspA family [Enhydrobacter aerosaccus]
MGYKVILVHCDGGKTAAGRIGVAVELASRFDAHLVGLYVRPRFEAPIFSDGSLAMDALYRNYEAAVKADEAAASGLFKAALEGKGRSYEWHTAEGYADEALADFAHGADLVVVSQAEPEPSAMGALPDLPERLALATERPVLVVPHIGVTGATGKTVLLCWNGRRESGRAAADALPLLEKADKVLVLTIDPPKGVGDEEPTSAASAVTWLERHGVKAALQRDTAADADVGDIILSRAADSSADLIVMGVYGHSRVREMMLGGASRTILSSMTVPILIAH